MNLKSLINAKNLNKLERVAKLKEERSIVVIISRRNIKFTGHHSSGSKFVYTKQEELNLSAR